MLSTLFLLSILFASATADDGYVCAGQRMINPPDNNIYTYPADWDEGKAPPMYAGSQDCEWQINVLPGMYAKVIFLKDTDDETGITTTYPTGQVQYIEEKQMNPFIFTYPQFKVNLRVSDKQGRFAFKVVWLPYPGACQWNNELTETGAFAMVPNQCVTTFTAVNKVMLVGFNLINDLDVLLRQTAIFEGDSVNGTYLGNLYYLRYNKIVSATNKLTIFTWNIYRNFNYTLYMGMDTAAAGDIEQFNGLNCPTDPSKQCYAYLEGDDKVSAVATVGRHPDYVQKLLSFPLGSTLKVYEGIVSDSTLLATINQSNYMNQLPLGVKNSLKIYKLDTGRVVLPLTSNAANAQWPIVFDGRFVNVQSFDYKRNSYTQDTLEVFKTVNNNEKLYFNFKVNNIDWNINATLDVAVARDGKNIFAQKFSSTNPPPQTMLKLYGDQITFDYKTYGNYTMGFQIDLNTVKNEDVSPATSTVIPPTSSTSTPSSAASMGSTTTKQAAPSGSTTTVLPPNPSATTSNSRGVSLTTPGQIQTTTKISATNFSVSVLMSFIAIFYF